MNILGYEFTHLWSVLVILLAYFLLRGATKTVIEEGVNNGDIPESWYSTFRIVEKIIIVIGVPIFFFIAVTQITFDQPESNDLGVDVLKKEAKENIPATLTEIIEKNEEAIAAPKVERDKKLEIEKKKNAEDFKKWVE